MSIVTSIVVAMARLRLLRKRRWIAPFANWTARTWTEIAFGFEERRLEDACSLPRARVPDLRLDVSVVDARRLALGPRVGLASVSVGVTVIDRARVRERPCERCTGCWSIIRSEDC